MSVYNNDKGTSKIYSNLNPTAPKVQQKYRLKELTEIQAYLLDEIEVRERLLKRMKKFNVITSLVVTGLITSAVITRGISIVAFANGVGLPVTIVLSGTSILATVTKSLKTFIIEQEKHDASKLLAQSKLDSIANINSQAMLQKDISSIEFHKVLQGAEKYRKLKTNIRNQAKTNVLTDRKRTVRTIA